MYNIRAIRVVSNFLLKGIEKAPGTPRQKSIVLTGILFTALFLLLIWFKMAAIKKEEIIELQGGGGGGEVAVNFGNSDVGSGDNYESRDLDVATSKQTAAESANQEELVTDDSENDAPAVTSVKKPKDEPKKPDPKPVEAPKPKPSKDALDALNSAISGNKKGDGDDDAPGNKGKLGGTVNTKDYGDGGNGKGGRGRGNGEGDGDGDGYGPGKGNGAGGGWSLAGRKLRASGKVQQKCNEYGKVVVEVTVNRQGDVIGCKWSKGTDNTAKCLIDAAYATARTYKWYPKEDANDKQVGTITVNFTQS